MGGGAEAGVKATVFVRAVRRRRFVVLGGSVELCLTLRSLFCTLIPKKRVKFGRKCSLPYGYATSLCVLVRDENRQLIAILRANVIRKIPIAKIESEYSSTTILQSEYLSTRAVAHGEATA